MGNIEYLDKVNTTHPLVSVVVICYNSSATIIETLESIWSQSYPNIELILTDDCSSDETIQLAQTWINDKGTRFVNTEIVISEKNTGVSGNCNRGVEKSKGQWIKTIAGDDLLIPTAIEQFICESGKVNENVRMCVCNVECFASEGAVPVSLQQSYDMYFKFAQESYKEQYMHVLQENIFTGPTFFYTRELYDEIGGFTSDYGNGEEWPFVYKVIRGGNRIYAIDKRLVKYRFSLKSLSHNSNNGLRNKNLELSTCNFFFDYPFKDLLKSRHYLIAWDCFLRYKSLQYYCNTDGALWSAILKNYSKFLSPYGYIKRIKRLINIK
jgi:alpha-1,3-rhamnosyltransferase